MQENKSVGVIKNLITVKFSKDSRSNIVNIIFDDLRE